MEIWPSHSQIPCNYTIGRTNCKGFPFYKSFTSWEWFLKKYPIVFLLEMIAKAMAKKIAKHVARICSVDAKASSKLTSLQEKKDRLEKKLKELEEQNKKLRLLLVESNKNLNSYKPSLFGFYRKVPPGQ